MLIEFRCVGCGADWRDLDVDLCEGCGAPEWEEYDLLGALVEMAAEAAAVARMIRKRFPELVPRVDIELGRAREALEALDLFVATL